MLYSQRRSMKSRQPGIVEVLVEVDGTIATPVASGQDALFVDSVQDLGTGLYKINLKAKSLQKLFPKSLVSYTEGAILHVVAVDQESITVQAVDPAGADLDASFAVAMNFSSEVPYLY